MGVQRTASAPSVRQLGRTLPEVVDGVAYGAPALKLRGKLLACRNGPKLYLGNGSIDSYQRFSKLTCRPASEP